MGLRRWLGIRKPLVSAEAAATAHILPDRPAFTNYLHRRANNRETNSPHLDKRQTATLIRELGFHYPETLATLSDAADFEPDKLPNRFVVKPSNLCATKGVMILKRQRDGSFFDLLQRRTLSADAIRDEQATYKKLTLKRQPDADPKIIVEEMIVDEFNPDIIPFDYKFYTFNGDVRFIIQIDRNSTPPKIAFYRDDFYRIDFQPYTKRKVRNMQFGSHRRPNCWKDLLVVASRISQSLRTPFISVDLYASADGPVVGEITPAPGGPYYGVWRFQPWFDLELGDAWTEAARELDASQPMIDHRNAAVRSPGTAERGASPPRN